MNKINFVGIKILTNQNFYPCKTITSIDIFNKVCYNDTKALNTPALLVELVGFDALKLNFMKESVLNE